MKRIFLFKICFILFLSCNQSGIQKETQDRIMSHKKIINQISFDGKVKDKKYCNECNFNKYQIVISTDDILTDRVEFGYQSYEPFYVISTDKKITLSVNSNLFEATQKGMKVSKRANSNNLSVNGVDYILLSSQKYVWLPETKIKG